MNAVDVEVEGVARRIINWVRRLGYTFTTQRVVGRLTVSARLCCGAASTRRFYFYSPTRAYAP